MLEVFDGVLGTRQIELLGELRRHVCDLIAKGVVLVFISGVCVFFPIK